MTKHTKNNFWEDAITNKLITIPTGTKWITKPINYRQLAKRLGYNFKTVDMISVDHFENLPSYLKQLDCGIIRVGSHSSSTDFILCRPTTGCLDLYLTNNIFNSAEKIPFQESDISKLVKTINVLDEKSGVAIFCNIFPFKNIFKDLTKVVSFPYKANHTFSFLIDEELELVLHKNGQIEIDMNVVIFPLLKRPRVIVIEAKFGKNIATIAKHKILYSTMLAKKLFGDNADIIPAYLHIIDYSTSVRMNFCILDMDYKDDMPILLSIRPKQAYYIEIERKGSLLYSK